MVLVDDRWGAILSATSTEKPCSWSCPLLDTRCGGWHVVDCCGTHEGGTVWEGLLTLVAVVGSLLRAALGPKTRASLVSLGLSLWSGSGIAWFFGSPVKESRWRVSISSETRPIYVRASMSQAFGSGIGDTYRGSCGSDEWQTGLHEEWTSCGKSVWTPVDAVTTPSTALGWTWIRGQPSHSDTLECVWLSMLCDNDGTMSWSSTGGHTSPLSEFLFVCLYGLPLLSCPLPLELFGFDTGPWTFRGPVKPPTTLGRLCVAFTSDLTTDPL